MDTTVNNVRKRRGRSRAAVQATGAALVLGLGVSGIATALPANAAGARPAHQVTPRVSPNDILTIAGDDGGPFPASENPYGTTNGLGQLTPFVYEPLEQFDWLKPTEVVPWLATNYAWSNGGRSILFTIRSGVKWSDGTPMTPADVVFTYDMIKKFPAVNFDGLDITSVSQVGSDQVKISFAKPAYNDFYYIASQYIVPQHIWSGYSNPSTTLNSNPVGTGPYLVSSYSPQAEVLKPNPSYWGTKPQVPEIVEPDILNNNTCDNELYTGQAQWGGCFLGSFAKFKANMHNVFDSSPEELQGLLPNMTTFPTNNVAFRQAVSLSLNNKAIAIAGDLGEEPWTTSPTGLVLPAEKAYLAPRYAGLKQTQNIAKAKAVLKAAGFSWNSAGDLQGPNGQPINVSILVVAAYSDNVAAAQTILQEWKAIGLQGTLKLEAPSAVTTDEENGHFQFAEWGSAGGLTPYNAYNSFMNSALTAPVGKTAVGDFGRFKSPAANAALAAFAGTTNLAVQKSAMARLEGIMINQLPLITFQYTVAWGEYNTKHFIGWPSASNPYALGTTYYTPEDELVILHLKPVG